MTKNYPRSTITNSVTISGPGLHSGEPTSVIIHPGNKGFVFRQGTTTTPATPENVTDTTRCTRISNISTVEHVLSALSGMGLTDAEIEVNGQELPAADGCAMPYVEAIKTSGITNCGNLIVDGPFARIYYVEEGKSFKYAVGLGEGYWRCNFELENSFVGLQELEFVWSKENYENEIAPARTFVLESELEAVRAYGLGKGLSEESCFGVASAGYMNPTRFPDEPVRHKLLDLIGDLALCGIPIAHLDVLGHWTGHTHNVALAAKISENVTLVRED